MLKQKTKEKMVTNYRRFLTTTWLFYKLGPLLFFKWFFAIILKKKFEIKINLKFRSRKVELFLESTFTDIKLLTEIFFLEVYRIDDKLNPKLIVDAGANKGLVSVYYNLFWPDCEINCFEPNPELIPILKKNLQINNVKFKVYNYAISNKDGYEYFNIHSNHQFSSLSEKITEHKVKTINIESFFDNKRIDILKLDVEGAEERIINSIKKFNIDCIIGEIHHDMIDENQLIDMLSKNYNLKEPRWQHFITNPNVKYPIVIALKK